MPTAVQTISARLQNAVALVTAAQVTELPLHIAAALTSKESNGANVYGNDAGGTFATPGAPDKPVTAANYADFYRLVVEQKHKSNGVGPLQITYRGYFPQAKALGVKLWVPFDNYRFGFRILKTALTRYGASPDGIAKAGTLYNAGNLNSGITAYGRDLAAKAATWKTRLAGATLPPVLRRGDKGPEIAHLQSALLTHFPTLAAPIAASGGADGSFGPATESAVKTVQAHLKLPADGTVGPWTRGRLTEHGITL